MLNEKKLQEVYEAIVQYKTKHDGNPPTRQHIAAMLGFGSRETAQRHIKRLEARGLLERDKQGRPMILGAIWKGPSWQLYDAGTDEEIRVRFLTKYGYLPPFIIRDGGGIKAGPLVKKERND